MPTVRIHNPSRENNGRALVVRTYRDKGNKVNDGDVLEAGETLVFEIDDTSFLQVDQCASKIAKGAPLPKTSDDAPVGNGVPAGAPGTEPASAIPTAVVAAEVVGLSPTEPEPDLRASGTVDYFADGGPALANDLVEFVDEEADDGEADESDDDFDFEAS